MRFKVEATEPGSRIAWNRRRWEPSQQHYIGDRADPAPRYRDMDSILDDILWRIADEDVGALPTIGVDDCIVHGA